MQVNWLECMLLVLLAIPLLYLLKIQLWQKQQREVGEWRAMAWLTEHVEAFVVNMLLQKQYGFARQFSITLPRTV